MKVRFPLFYAPFRAWVRGLAALLMLLSQSLYAQDPPQYGTPFSGVPDARDVNMYQVHIRPYSAAGNLPGVISRLDQIKALGTNVIYLMPIYPHGTDARSSQSPYCIKDFKAVASEYGSLTDLRTLVDGAHARGMAVMLDFVVNQTSWDHPWITQHPDWYVRVNGVIQQLAEFTDVAALDMNNTALRAAMIDAMRYWILAANIDGYRCDFANNAPLSFWTAVINNLRGITSHKLLMFAEGDRLENFQAGFDLNFGDKWFYDALEDVAKGGSVSLFQSVTNTEYTYAGATQQVVRYTANHDTETRTDGFLPFQLFQNHAGVVVNFLVSAYMRGVPFLTSGQEVDFNQAIPWPYTTVKINWSANPTAAADFTKILTFRTNSTAIRRGTLTNYSNNDVCAFTKISGSDKVVVMANLRNNSTSFVIPAALAGSYVDAYTGAAVTLTAGATQSLSNFQYRVLTNANVPNVPVASVAVSPASASFKVGLTQQLTATISPANATNQAITWSSGNTAVATVNSSGLVTGVSAGNATITATTVDGGKTATAAITVTPATSFTVYFYKPASWGTNIRLYYWNTLPTGSIPTVTWPGVSMTYASSGWYSYTFTNVTSTNLIFNDGTSQTADLTRSTTGWYQNNTWYNSNPGTPPVTETYYTIRNRWKNTYLYDAGGNVGYGTTAANNNYQWQKVAVDANYFWLKNRGTGEYMHIENQTGSVQCTAVTLDWWSAQWSQDNVDGTYARLRNRWQTGSIVHVEGQTGSAQYAGAQDGWYSAQWQLIPVSSGGRTAAPEIPVYEEATSSAVMVYPNPAKGNQLFVQLPELPETSEAAVLIQNVQGQSVLETKVKHSGMITHDLPGGLYFVRVRTANAVVIEKVVIER
ncbi:starch-binding protein [Fulvivirgaceae bacterium PWU5]|uniref:Starch-binding protein n=1 Tax=Dawidia cretensis TaxID=2782350 RepID=A0AAP2E4C0_9BACT|nr:alpha-amylase family glycosyl hydrolase [Dawidia cretensis]MBT1711467.1 starch-binding protein [Dawidia cretensis]